jgi:hypothetical protein
MISKSTFFSSSSMLTKKVIMYAEMNDITFFSLPEESYVHQILLFFTQKKKEDTFEEKTK